MTDKQESRRDIRQVKIDVTSSYKKLPPKVVKIIDHYVVDVSSRTFLCSAQPMAWLVGVRAEFVVDGELTDEEQDFISTEEYGCSPDDTYMDWQEVKKMEFIRFEDDPNATDEAAIEAARVHFRENHQ